MNFKVCSMLVPVFAAFLLSGTAGSSSGSKPSPQPQELTSAANASSSLTEAMPYQLTASFVLTPDKKTEIKGQLTIYREKDRQRMEITVGDDHQTRLRLGDKEYLVGTVALLRGHMLETLETAWAIPSLPVYGPVTRKKFQGTNAYCFVGSATQRRPRRYCVDPEKKFLLETNDGFEAMNFLDYRTVDGRQYPSKIQVVDGGKVFLQIQDIEVRKGPAGVESFNVPPGALEFEKCDGLEPAHALQMNMPRVPSIWHSSYATLRGVVQTDGSMQDVKVVVWPPNPDFAQALKERAAQWRFSPAHCGTKQVAYEEQMEIHN